MSLRRILAKVKRKLFKKPFAKNKKYQAFWFDKILKDKSALIVQIGSNDGKTGDPIYPLFKKYKKWKGLFVEPIPRSFEKLKTNYPDPNRFSFENVAINEGLEMTFYWVDPIAKESLPDLPYWYDQLNSFDKDHIVNQLDGVLEPFIKETLMEGIRLEELLTRNGVQEISILHIDTEGYDWKILQQLDLKRYQPTFILYEYNHLSLSDKEASFSFLKRSYDLFDVGIDILAVNKNLGTHHLQDMAKHMKKIVYTK